MHVGNEGWPVWSNPTDKLLLLKLLELMLVLIERCQNTQCISLLSMGLHSCRPGQGAHADPCPLLKVPTMGT